MMFEYYYLIEPKENLIKLLSAYDNDDRKKELVESLRCSHAWKRIESDWTDGWTSASLVRLVFLGELKSFVGNSDLIKGILGDDFPISIEVFDRYWTIERHRVTHDYEESLDRLSLDILEEITIPEDHPIVKGVIEQAKERMRRYLEE